MVKKAAFGVIEIGAAPAALGELRSWRIPETADEIDTSVMGTGNKRITPGAVGEQLEADCYFEDADAGQVLIVVGDETPVLISIYPQGKGTGLPVAAGNFTFLSKTTEGEVSGAVDMTFTASSDEDGIAWTQQA